MSGKKRKVRNVPFHLLRDLNLEGQVETIVQDEGTTPVSEFKEWSNIQRDIRPKTHAPAEPVLTTGREDDEKIYAANHPGDLQRLGFGFYSWTNDIEVPENPTAQPQKLFEIEMKENDVFIVMDWRNYALKEVGGNLFAMNPGELDNSNFSLTIRRGGGHGAGLGFWAYGPGAATPGASQFEVNAIGSLDEGSTFTWPGRFRYIVRGPERIAVYIHYKSPALPPYAIPKVVASKLMGFYRFG